jgi:thiosulfate dehydrogenase (quinone) large subunit
MTGSAPMRDEPPVPVGRNLGFDGPTCGHKEGELILSNSPSAVGGRLAVPMGPRSDVQAPTSEYSHGVDSYEKVEPTPQMDSTLRSSGHNLRIADWLFRSSAASLIWLIVRVVIGYWWLNAGYQKIWGSEKSAFWFGGGAGVKGFATAGVAGSATGKGGASYGWWAAVLHNFVIPNASWIAKFIALGELAIGIALILGLFTGLVALCGLTLNLVYMFTGSAGVNPAYAILEVPLILAWRNAGYLGLDRFALSGAWRKRHVSKITDRAAHRPTTVPVPALTH